MHLDTETRNGALLVRVDAPRIDAVVAIQFKDRMREATTGAEQVISRSRRGRIHRISGLGAIVAAMKQLGAGRRLEFVNLQPNVDKVFRLTRMDTVFRIHSSLEAGLRRRSPGSPVMCAEAVRPGHLENALAATDRAWPDAGLRARCGACASRSACTATAAVRPPSALCALVLAEVLNNVVEHAFPSCLPSWIGIGLRFDGLELGLTVTRSRRCHARWRPAETAPRAISTSPRGLPEGGFGWALIRQLTGHPLWPRGQTNRLSLALDLPSLARPGVAT